MIERAIAIMKQIWASFIEVAMPLVAAGGRIAIEWPDQCDYWQLSEVRAFFEKWRLLCTTLDGCMYGVVSQFGKTKGFL